MQSTRVLWLVCVKIILCSTCFGQLVHWKAAGTFQVPNSLPDWLRDGESEQRYEIGFVTDKAMPPIAMNPQYNTYAALEGFAKIGSHSFIFDSFYQFYVGNFDGQYGFYLIARNQSVGLDFVFGLKTTMHSGNLEIPTSIPPLEDFDVYRFMEILGDQPTFSALATLDTFTADATPVPEPSTYGLLGILALLGLVVQRRLRK